ncbi:MAG: hypothetical protein WBA41_16225 [Rivularia sp. (in: cyanobacteria)]
MKSDKNKMQIVKRYCLSIFSSILLLSTVFFGVSQAAVASPIDGYSQQMIIAANPLRGTGDRLAGEAEQALGKAQRNLGDSTEQTLEGAGKEVKGLAKQARGGVKQGIENTKSAADKASDKAERGGKNFIDTIKGFFGN